MTTNQPPRPRPRTKKPVPSIVYKVVILIVLVGLLYLVWELYNRLPPTRPFQYPADYIPYLRTISL